MIFNIIVGGFVVISIYWYYRMWKSLRWMRRNRSRGTPHEISKKLFVVIPVLDEVSRIERTADYFLNTFSHLKRMIIVIVTTEKEYEVHRGKNASKNTIDVVKDLSKKYPQIIHSHYPKTTGKMAHQLNHAIGDIIKDNEDCLIAVYNADSRPHKDTVDWVLGRDDARVFQQYGCYLKNTDEFPPGLAGSILLAAGGWQTRWSIGFEIYNALQQLEYQQGKKKILMDLRYPLNYCIGHGLFFTPDIFRELLGFSEDTHNEDAIFGLELSYLHELIMPVPLLEMADSPNSVKALFTQKSTWFFGPLQAFNYIPKIRERRNVNLMQLYTLTFKLFMHAIYWVVGPTLMTLALVLALVDFNAWKLLAFGGMVTLHLTIPNYLAWGATAKTEGHPSLRVFSRMLIGSPICYFLHGLSAYRTLGSVAISTLTGRAIQKGRTPI